MRLWRISTCGVPMRDIIVLCQEKQKHEHVMLLQWQLIAMDTTPEPDCTYTTFCTVLYHSWTDLKLFAVLSHKTTVQTSKIIIGSYFQDAKKLRFSVQYLNLSLLQCEHTHLSSCDSWPGASTVAPFIRHISGTVTFMRPTFDTVLPELDSQLLITYSLTTCWKSLIGVKGSSADEVTGNSLCSRDSFAYFYHSCLTLW